MLAWLGKIKAYLIAAGIAVALIGVVIWRIFAAGERSGRQEVKDDIDRGVQRIRKRMREADKPKGEKDAIDRMDGGGF